MTLREALHAIGRRSTERQELERLKRDAQIRELERSSLPQVRLPAGTMIGAPPNVDGSWGVKPPWRYRIVYNWRDTGTRAGSYNCETLDEVFRSLRGFRYRAPSGRTVRCRVQRWRDGGWQDVPVPDPQEADRGSEEDESRREAASRPEQEDGGDGWSQEPRSGEAGDRPQEVGVIPSAFREVEFTASYRLPDGSEWAHFAPDGRFAHEFVVPANGAFTIAGASFTLVDVEDDRVTVCDEHTGYFHHLLVGDQLRMVVGRVWAYSKAASEALTA